MNAADLANRLEALTTEASESYDTQEAATRAHWRALVRAYLFWRDCQGSSDFLDEQYAANGIKGYRLGEGNRPNFNPLLRLVFRKSLELRNSAARIGQRAAALAALHAEFEDNSKRYRKDAEAKLLAFMSDNGGISGLGQLDQEARALRDGRTGPGGVAAPKEREPDEEFGVENLTALRKAALSSAVTSSGIASFVPSRPVRVGKDDMLVLLGKRQADGTVVVVGSTNEAEALAATMLHANDYTLANLPSPFRVLVETVRTQMYPPFALSSDLKLRRQWEAKHADRSHITTKQLPTWDGKGKAERVMATKKLLVRAADQSILLSMSALTSSVVTLCKPIKGAFPYVATKPEPLHRDTAMRIRAQLAADPTLDESELVLASGDYHYEPMRNAEAAMEGKGLRFLERMIETAEIFSIGVKPAVAKFAGYGRHRGRAREDRWIIELQRQHEQQTRALSFYDTWRDAGAVLGFQPTFDCSGWKPAWKAEVEPIWFGQLREKLLDGWFASFGGGTQLARATNQAMRFALDGKQLAIGFNFDPRHDAAAPSVSMPLATQHEATWLHLSRDVAPALYNVADAEIVGNVTLAGNDSALVITYSSAVAAFSIAVPTAAVTTKGVSRSAAGFVELRYG